MTVKASQSRAPRSTARPARPSSSTRSLPPPPRERRLLRYSTDQRAPVCFCTSYGARPAAAGISNLPRPAPLARGEPISAIINQLVATPVEAGPGFQTPGSRFFSRGPRRLGTELHDELIACTCMVSCVHELASRALRRPADGPHWRASLTPLFRLHDAMDMPLLGDCCGSPLYGRQCSGT